MKNLIYLLAGFMILLAGCFTTMPVVNNAYLTNKSDAEKQDLIKIQRDIIEINKGIKEIEKNYGVIKQKYNIIDRRILFLKQRRPLLEEYVKLYLLLGDSEKLGKARGDLSRNEDNIKFNNDLLILFNLNKEHEKGVLEEKHAGLAVKIAEQELEKAYILGKSIPDKAATGKPEAKYKGKSCKLLSSAAEVNVCTIIEHYNKRKKTLEEKKKETKRLLAKFQKAQEKIKKYDREFGF